MCVIDLQEAADNVMVLTAHTAEGDTAHSLDASDSNIISAISTSLSSRSRAADPAAASAQRMEVYMQMEAVRIEVRDRLSQQTTAACEATETVGGASSSDQKSWQVLEMLGKGSTGEVFKCKWRGLAVAIKQIKFQVSK